MTILENNLHLKPRQTRGTELYRFRNYVALGILSVGTLIGLAFNYSKIAESALEHHKKYVRVYDPPQESCDVEARSKSPADLLKDFKEDAEFAKYN